jgi:alpha-galactosidase
MRAKDTLGQSRTYFGLWSIMKSPLLLSSNLAKLPSEVIAIVNNTGVIAVNQVRHARAPIHCTS